MWWTNKVENEEVINTVSANIIGVIKNNKKLE
jgi:hypothetical protein